MHVGKEQNTGRIGVSLVEAAFGRLGLIFREQFVHDYGFEAHVELVEDGCSTGRLLSRSGSRSIPLRPGRTDMAWR